MILQMCKKLLRVAQMHKADVLEARTLLAEMFGWEYAGHGDTENALRRIGTRHGLSFGEVWSLRYRPPKRIFSDLLKRLRDAHAAECERQLRKLAHELEVTARVAGAHHPVVVEVQAVLGAHLPPAAAPEAPPARGAGAPTLPPVRGPSAPAPDAPGHADLGLTHRPL